MGLAQARSSGFTVTPDIASANNTAPVPHKFSIPLDDFLNRTHAGPKLTRSLRDVNALIPANELYDLHRSNTAAATGTKCEVLPQTELFDLLRTAPDNSGREVYADARFELGRVMVPPAYSVQTYVTHDGLRTIWIRDAFMRSLGAEGFNSEKAYVITHGDDVKYAAILVPPLVINYMKAGYDVTLRNLETMVERGDRMSIKGETGEVQLDLAGLLNTAKAELAKLGPSIQVVKDGTHRAYAAYRTQTPLAAIVISNAPELPTSVPISFDRVVLCAERPPRPEQRYPGMHKAGMVDIERIGIDP